MSDNIKGCYVFYDPNGGTWPDGTTEKKPSPTENGILHDRDDFIWPEGTNEIKRDGYRLHTSKAFLNVPRYYSSDGKGNGFNTAKDYNNGFGYDFWPYNSEELTNNGHDHNYFAQYDSGFKDGDSCTLYICWDPLVKYETDGIITTDYVYKTDGDEYTVLDIGGETMYAKNKSDWILEHYDGPLTIPSVGKDLMYWESDDGRQFVPGNKYTILEPVTLHAKWKN